ncbi:MAG: pyridoxal phosphate-dependent aminotransferase [Candidatus Sumerlaeia bacterium]|nr:pyridoxal phosphate-dependent aminotransferase [Candidatus Sumerlaeia bacterium]
MKISKKAAGIAPSLTLALTAKAKAMRAEGIDVISFGAGEPDFDTPDFVKNVAIEDLKAGVTKYTPVPGTPELREAIVEALDRDYGLKYEVAETLVSVGGKHTLFNIFFVLLDEGDEVVIPSPFWLSYPEQVKACGGKPVIVTCPPEAGFKLSPAQLREAITPKTRAVILNSPSNPTGAVYTKEELLALADVLKEFPEVTIISDDLYQKLVYDGAEFNSLATLVPEFRNRIIIVNGLSKAYSMTGWRLGWCAAPASFIKAMSALQGQSTSNPVSFTQRAAAVALRSDHGFLDSWLKAFDGRRRLIVEGLNSLKGVKCDPAPKGAFYAFPDVSDTYGMEIGGKKITDSMTFAEAFLEVANVSVVPGVAFGEDRCVRLSYATSESNIEKGLARLAKYLK